VREGWRGSLVEVLHHYEQVLFVWRNHDLVLLAAQPEEGEVVGGVEVPDDAPRLVREPAHERSVLHRGGVIQRALDRHAFIIDDDDANYAFMRLNSLQGFFNFS